MFERWWKAYLRRPDLSGWSLLVPLFWLASAIYRVASRLHRVWPRTVMRVSIPIISVGNITVGGTGKTPVVAMLARSFIEEGFQVGIISSGWGRHSDDAVLEPGYKMSKLSVELTGDEVKLLAMLLPEAIFSVDSSKTIAAERLAEHGGIDLMIVDDGFQHFGLARDVDIVTYDAAVESRRLKTFPIGVLREPLTGLKRADIILITRANFAEDITQLRQKLTRINPGADMYHAQFFAPELVGSERRYPIKYLDDKSVFLFAGIGNFIPLRRQLDALAGDLDEAMELSDHQVYTPELLSEIKRRADSCGSDVIVTTGKDWVKLGSFDFGREIYYLGQSIDLDPGEEKLTTLLRDKLNLQKRGR
ncbi:MAG: tetraacyldisaccharide 4'-kinase [candidate division Zixibacteria bacterium]|nr:tetraacyldisaccharide 4'-kinase [candidate division Zixibacteria bacterium]